MWNLRKSNDSKTQPNVLNAPSRSSVLDIEALLQPISENAPCGHDLSGFPFDEAFFALSQRFVWNELATTDPLEKVDWRQVSKTCETLFTTQCKSARIVNIWALALIHQHGLEGLKASFILLTALVKQYWDVFEPSECDDEGHASPARGFVLQELVGPLVLKMINRVIVLEARALGKITVERLLAQKDQQALVEYLKKTPEALQFVLSQRTVLMDLLDVVPELQKEINARLETPVKFAPLIELLNKMKGFLEPLLPNSVLPQQLQSEPQSTESTVISSNGMPAKITPQPNVPEVSSRQQVIELIEKIERYYAQVEPSSPVPMLLGRAKKWAGMSFSEVIKDINPKHLDEMQHLFKIDSD